MQTYALKNIDMLRYIINQFALKSETIVETKLHTVSNLSKAKYEGPDVCWDAPKIPVFGVCQHTFVKALLNIHYRFFLKILTWYFQNFFDCRGNHMRSESVN